MKHRLASASLAIAALAPFALAQGTQDTIYVAGNDKPIKAKITEETLAGVGYSAGGAVRSSAKWDQIVRISYGEGEGPFKAAEEALAKGDAAAAQKALESIQNPRDIFVPRRLVLLGRALQGTNPKEAEAKYAEVVQKHPDSIWVKRALKALIELQKSQNNYAGALQTAENGIKIAQGAKLDSLALEFRLEKASVLESQDQPDKLAAAVADYQKIAADASSSAPKVAQLAKAHQSYVMARQRDTAKARALVEDVLKSDDPSLLTVGHRAMGEALLVEGITESNAEKLREAAVSHFLRVEVQFPPSAGDSQEALETSLFGFLRACQKLADLEKGNKEAAEFWKAQLASHCRDFKDRFPTSRFRKQADDICR